MIQAGSFVPDFEPLQLSKILDDQKEKKSLTSSLLFFNMN